MLDVEHEVIAALTIEHVSRTHFNYDVKIKRIIADDLETLKNSRTTIFETTDHKLFAFCTSQDSLELGDVKRIMRGMGIKVSQYLPPAQNHSYFVNYGNRAFSTAFPGRHMTLNDNLSFYQSLAPYTPALVKIKAITNGIYGYIPALGEWYKAVDMTYFQVRNSL